MKELLQQLGINKKEAQFYTTLLEAGTLTALEVAKAADETRTNAYMILERLTADSLVVVDDSAPVRKYAAADPNVLKRKLLDEQHKLKQKNALLAAALPELTNLYRLNQHKPGVLYLEGLKGFKALLDDNARSSTGIDLIASEDIIHNREAWEALQKGIAKRAARGIHTRGLFYATDQEWAAVKKFEKQGYEVRRWGVRPLPGEAVIYEDKVALTTYQPTIICTILTNDVIAATLRLIFQQLWQGAEA